jgi:Leucine-rich repeat (LRR) protein
MALAAILFAVIGERYRSHQRFQAAIIRLYNSGAVLVCNSGDSIYPPPSGAEHLRQRDTAPPQNLLNIDMHSVRGIHMTLGEYDEEDLEPLSAIDGLERLSLAESRFPNSALRFIGNSRTLRALDLEGSSVDDCGLRELRGLAQLQVLRLGSTAVTDLVELRKLQELEGLGLSDTRVTDASIPTLLRLPRLRWIDLSRTKVGGSGVAVLSQSRSLTVISLDGIGLRARALHSLGNMVQLEALSISETGTTGAGIEHLSRLTNLRELTLSNNHVDDEGFCRLHGLDSLEMLYLGHTGITDRSIEHIVTEFPNVCALSVTYTQVTDAGVRSLVDLPLTHLHLQGTAVGDSSVELLSSMKHLQLLDVTRSSITPKGVSELERALPHCQILGG